MLLRRSLADETLLHDWLREGDLHRHPAFDHSSRRKRENGEIICRPSTVRSAEEQDNREKRHKKLSHMYHLLFLWSIW